ncbi:hypothetical protein TSAR_008645 [Trichomalopsis sarcophagae]|uniref:Cystatin domain-containing protein n=1 Tax=Trichomalopsis sarcophagae TaxID=543379 RepID=A0A232F2Y3_9HYME|nr:hypothetical protein TSAR_008645 [Trichomalopsis sarcophagae]
MALQHILLFTIFATLAVSAQSESTVARHNDLVIGRRVEGDYLLNRSFIKKDASWIGKVVTFTKTFTGDGVSTITQIKALDQHENGHGASAKVIAGGVDYLYVTLRLESERYRHIDFVVEIYGKKASTE